MSTFWIIVLNSWMHTPQGFEIRDGVVYATSWLEIIFNPSMPYRFTHMMLASCLTVAFLIAGVSALRMLWGDRGEDVKSALRVAIIGAGITGLTAAFELRHGGPEVGVDLASAVDMLKHAPLDRFLVAMAARVNPEKAEGKEMIVNLVFTDVGTSFVLELQNSVLHHYERDPNPDAGVTLKITKDLFLQMMAGTASIKDTLFGDDLKIEGSKLGLTAKGKKALSQPLHEVVKELYERWQRKGAPDELRRVDLIKGQTSKGVRLSAPIDRRLVIEDALLACCTLGKWLSVDDLFRQMKVEGHRFEVAGNPWKLYLVDPNYGSLGYDGGDDFETLEARYTLVYLFEYLATLGLFDVAYSLPYGARPDYTDRWGTDELEFLSRYDGLRYLRLTNLGAYCLGLSDTYTPSLAERPPLLRVESGLSLALLRPAEPAEQLQLEQIATPLASDRWGLNSEAILARGADADERDRIRQFIETSLEGGLPAELSDLLDGIDERATALTDAGRARLIQCRDAALAILFSSDPATAAYCSRVGERHLCIADKKLAAFRKGVTKLGFVLPELAP